MTFKSESANTKWRRVAAGVLLFGISFGYVEAAVVVYLRMIVEPVRRKIAPQRSAGDLFPLLTQQQFVAAAPELSALNRIEMVREAATLVMLGAVAAAASQRQAWLPPLAIAFGTWDLFFYVFLKILIGWPSSLLTWDILFLVPVPWAAPVLAPTLVSISIIAGGLVALRRPVRMEAMHRTLFALGCVLILASFMWDFRNIMAGGQPNPFAWRIFGAGEVLGVGGFVHAVLASKVKAMLTSAASVSR